MIKKAFSIFLVVGLLLCLFSAAYAQNQDSEVDILRAEIKAQLAKNLKELNIEGEYKRIVHLDITEDLDTIRNSSKPIKIYSETITSEENDSRNVGILSTPEIVWKATGETWWWDGRPISYTSKLEAWKRPVSGSGDDYKLHKYYFTWSNNNMIDGVTRIDNSKRQRDCRDISDDYRLDCVGTWSVSSNGGSMTTTCYPNNYVLIIESNGYCVALNNIRMYWQGYGNWTVFDAVGWNDHLWNI